MIRGVALIQSSCKLLRRVKQMIDEGLDNPTAKLDQQINEVARALELTVAFLAALRSSDADGVARVKVMVGELKGRLRTLQNLRI